jgi:hypothetical protein
MKGLLSDPSFGFETDEVSNITANIRSVNTLIRNKYIFIIFTKVFRFNFYKFVPTKTSKEAVRIQSLTVNTVEQLKYMQNVIKSFGFEENSCEIHINYDLSEDKNIFFFKKKLTFKSENECLETFQRELCRFFPCVNLFYNVKDKTLTILNDSQKATCAMQKVVENIISEMKNRFKLSEGFYFFC